MKKIQIIGLVFFAFTLVNCSSKPKKVEEVSTKKEVSAEKKEVKEITSEAPAEITDQEISVFLDEGFAPIEEVPAGAVHVGAVPVVSQGNVISSTISSVPAQPGYIIVDESAPVMTLDDSQLFEADGMSVSMQSSLQQQPVYAAVQELPQVTERIAESRVVVLEQPASSVSAASGDPAYRIVELDLDAPAVGSEGSQSIELSAEMSTRFKNGYYSFISDCNMRAGAAKSAPVLGQVSKGKTLWVDGYSDGWAKVYRKAGPAYVSKKCF